MSSEMHLKIWIILMMAVGLAFVSLSPSTGYAQDSIIELERNVNASGREYQGLGARMAGEIGMGLVGELSAAVVGGGIALGIMSWGGIFGGLLAAELTVTPLTAGGVYLGGWLAGGRGKAGPVFGGAYAGAAVGWVLLGVGVGCNDTLMYAGAIVIPVLSLVGAVVGYELSEKYETNRLIAERDKQMQQRTVPIMINLFSGTF
ncbi:MAG: hypothetical protein IKY83_09520 [Proteobacteria bacterium]|nr:hypothetical protein [Pseudomonadota bacterium]